jgi:hypothetical protein
MRLKPLLLGLLVNGLLMCPVFGQSGGSSSNADIDACSHELLERSIAEKSRPINPNQLPIFKTEITRILNVVDQKFPDFGQALRGVFKKNWRYGFDKMDDSCLSENSYWVNDYLKTACQDDGEAVLNPDYFETLDRKSCQELSNDQAKHKLDQQQIDMIVHQMLLGISRQTHIGQNSFIAMFKVLTSPTLKASDLDGFYQKSPFFRIYDKDGKPCDPPSPQTLTDVAAQSVTDGTRVADHISNGPVKPASNTLEGIRASGKSSAPPDAVERLAPYRRIFDQGRPLDLSKKIVLTLFNIHESASYPTSGSGLWASYIHVNTTGSVPQANVVSPGMDTTDTQTRKCAHTMRYEDCLAPYRILSMASRVPLIKDDFGETRAATYPAPDGSGNIQETFRQNGDIIIIKSEFKSKKDSSLDTENYIFANTTRDRLKGSPDE